MLDASSEIVASDVDEAKLLELSRRAKRAGVSNIRTLSASRVEDEIAKGGKFDVIMVDAPCSGTGTIRRSPDIKYRIDGSVVGGRLEVQRELLEKNLRYLKKDGRIVYATCSVLSSENEGIVQPFISKSGLQNVSAGEIFCALGVDISKIVDRSGYFRTNPADGDWDGFFAAVMINN
jgi:16S rRNA (cytosine967-C5)-methyltransferase